MESEALPPSSDPFTPDGGPAATGLRPGVLPELRTLDPVSSLEPVAGVRDSILRREALYRHSLATADVIAASIAVLTAFVMLGATQASNWTLLAIPAVVVVAKVVGLYDRDRDLVAKTTLDEAPTLFQVAMLYTLVLTAGAAVVFGGNLEPLQVLGLCATFFGSLLVLRTAARTAVLAFSSPERCLVIADKQTFARVRSKLESSRFVNVEIVGRAAPSPTPGTADDAIGSLGQLRAMVSEREVHRVILATAPGSADHLDAVRLLSSLGVRVSLAPRLFEVVGPSVRFDHVDGLSLMGVPAFGLSRSSQVVKRCFDLAVAGLGVALLTPLFAAIAIAIKLGSPGPVFFRQARIGRRGRQFMMIKFRSMTVDAEARKANLIELNEAGRGLFKLANDPRITRVGLVLRRLSLDELPQLLNVLKGDMSLVGPRPLVPEDDCFVEGWDRRRLAVLPGITGAWQILGSSRVPMEEMVKLDYLYAANWSLWNDFKLLIRTIPLVYGRRGI